VNVRVIYGQRAFNQNVKHAGRDHLLIAPLAWSIALLPLALALSCEHLCQRTGRYSYTKAYLGTKDVVVDLINDRLDLVLQEGLSLVS